MLILSGQYPVSGPVRTSDTDTEYEPTVEPVEDAEWN